MSILARIWHHDYFPNHGPRTYIFGKIKLVLSKIRY